MADTGKAILKFRMKYSNTIFELYTNPRIKVDLETRNETSSVPETQQGD